MLERGFSQLRNRCGMFLKESWLVDQLTLRISVRPTKDILLFAVYLIT